MSEITYRWIKGNLYRAFEGLQIVAHATVDTTDHYTRTLFVNRRWQRKGIGTGMVAFIAKDYEARTGHKLRSAPDRIKNDKVRGITAKLKEVLGLEAPPPKERTP